VQSKGECHAVPAATLLSCLGKAHMPYEAQYNQGKKKKKTKK